MKFYKLSILSLCSIFLLMNVHCEDEDDTIDQVLMCGQYVSIDAELYNSAQSSFYNLVDVEIQGDCLNVILSSSGCDGSSWTLDVIDSDAIAESSPEQRFLKLVFFNQEVCLAIFNLERSYDLSSLQIEGSNDIILNIEGFAEPLMYSY